ncbi:hypothetical protein XpopCFBP1817_09710 [Xanthomonas populi]|uniref:PAAR domain-containing protein n=1 Tax=Xanthomonas populi TaxID=53414 RepID=A0A2S7EPN5_9XANT|nr:PAAR domain-containing protein [Xanthomonas populi]PPU94747.1 hypothetical protein XpopCFBP1817_09710 [Xanthomonas populi]
MRMLIVVGDYTTGGGHVVSGSMETDIDGKPVARIGDRATCSTHQGVFPIVTGDATLMIDGQPVARHGDKLACGCALISGKQPSASIDSGSAATSGKAMAAASASASVALLLRYQRQTRTCASNACWPPRKKARPSWAARRCTAMSWSIALCAATLPTPCASTQKTSRTVRFS